MWSCSDEIFSLPNIDVASNSEMKNTDMIRLVDDRIFTLNLQELDQPYVCRGFIIFMKLKSSKTCLTRKRNQNQALDQSSSVGINMDE